MLKKADIARSSERLEVRLTPAEKKYLKLKASKGGYISMADFIISAARGIPMHDSRYDKIVFDTLDRIALELNKTGVNINQAVHVLNIQKLQGSISDNIFSDFIKLLAGFNKKQDDLLQILRKLRFE